ncbi:N-6 DNA methylase [bacterium]|nr:N-6 DNA methylase [bacterium]RQV92061.1 MAG: restriction endonuclease subunit M [bacterium]
MSKDPIYQKNQTMTKTPKTIKELVEKFHRNLKEYRSPQYNETNIRVEFVNPFWEALGWDVLNKSGHAMAYRDVIHEDEVKVSGTTKAPDYSFRIGGKRIFFMETKKPAVDLKHNPAPAFQLRRYAYSARLPASLLTDFEEFIVYDTRIKPALSDKSHVGRMLYYTFEEYLEKWDEIQSVFSKESVMRGDFDRFIQDKQGKKPRAEIDRDFLNDLDNWRIELARNIALRNPGLSERELNFAVQLTIDRLIFLRMSEDRGIESQYTLRALLNGEHVYPRLVEIYYRADERYNSGLFHFEEKDGPDPDVITPSLKVDDRVMKDILRHLYYPDCPYEFSVLPVEVLGNAYEQFLGKRITLTQGHHARIEEKPEVRKAGGVYYTPQYIVDYIVKNTVGKLVEGKTPKDVGELRICDPACGSGSFLLGAYQYLLDWYLDAYRKEYEKTGILPKSPTTRGQRPRKSDPQAIFQGMGGQWFLSTAEKKRILLNHIYGVDIDANAVEVTKLSLLLKVLENENSETLHSQMKIWHERALPNLSNNIKCGNSLIGPDFYENQQSALFDEAEALRINAFDWEREFPEIFAKGGFDAVIGNPPYVVVKGGRYTSFEEHPFIISYYKNRYKYATMQINLFNLFLEKSFKIMREKALFGMIIPNTLLTNDGMKELRNFLIKNTNITHLLNEGTVFEDAGVEALICIYLKEDAKQNNKITIKYEDNIYKVNQSVFLDPHLFNRFLINITDDILEIIIKCSENSKTLGEICEVWRGLTTGNDKKFLCNKRINRDYKPIIQGAQIKRYFLIKEELYVNYLPDKLDRPRRKEIFEVDEKIVSKFVGKSLAFCFDNEKYYVINTGVVIYLKNNIGLSTKYVLGILNSKLLSFYFKTVFTDFRNMFPIVKSGHLEKLPIKKVDFKNALENRVYNKINTQVEQILNLNEKLSDMHEPHTRETLQRQIDTTDAQIDKLVYELYGLTEEEIKIVEGSV